MLIKKYFVFMFILICHVKYGLLAGCNDNEVTSKCVNKLCQYTNCSQIDQPIVCGESSTEVCKEGCVCKDKYLRADNGTCIPFTKCPNYGKCNKENEYYDLCPSPCISRVCGVSKLSTSCSQTSAGNSTCLPPACTCKIGFYRNYDGNCVVESLCASNSSSSTTVSTETTQSTTSETASTTEAPTSSSISSTTPTATSSTTLISTTISQSLSNSTIQKCRKYEKYEKNPCTLCQPFTCSQVGYSLACLQSDYSKTCTLQPGCICIDGYVRNDKNVCVAVNKCPSCGGDVNAESGCRVICSTCNDYWNKKSTACSKLCKLNGCGCKKRYVYDAEQNKCVNLRNYCPIKGK